MLRLIAYFRLIRIHNCLLAAASVGIGAWMTAYQPTFFAPTIAAIAAFFVCAAGNCHNDLVDIDLDRVSHPSRVLPSGELSPSTARISVYLLNIIGVGLAWVVGYVVTIIVVFAISLLLLYNVKAKRLPGVGNLIIATLSGLVFLAGGAAVEPKMTLVLPGPLIPAVFAFLFHLVRELVKDVQDLEGDRTAGMTTLPQVVGASKTLLLALGLFATLVLTTLVPVFAGWFGPVYKVVAVYLVDLPLLALLIVLWGNPTRKMLAVASIGLKFGMGLGLVAILLS